MEKSRLRSEWGHSKGVADAIFYGYNLFIRVRSWFAMLYDAAITIATSRRSLRVAVRVDRICILREKRVRVSWDRYGLDIVAHETGATSVDG